MNITQLIQKYTDPVFGIFKNNAPLKAITAATLREWVVDFAATLRDLVAELPSAVKTDWIALGQFPITLHGPGVASLVDSQPGYFGLLQLSTTGANGGGHVTTNKLLLEKSLLLQTAVKIPALSTGGDSFYYRFGLLADPAIRNQVDGIYFEYSHDVNGGQWMFNSYKAGILTQALSTMPVAIDTRYELTLRYQLGNGVVFSINGVDVATLPFSSLPLASIGLQYANGIRKYNGAANRNLFIDSDLLIYNLAQ